jgi:hypothetical protein
VRQKEDNLNDAIAAASCVLIGHGLSPKGIPRREYFVGLAGTSLLTSLVWVFKYTTKNGIIDYADLH